MPWSVANLNLDIVCRTVFSIVFFIFTCQAGVSIQLSDKLFFSSPQEELYLVSIHSFSTFGLVWDVVLLQQKNSLILTVFVFQAFTHTCVCDSEAIVAVDLRDIVAFSIPWAATQLRFINFLLILIIVSEEQLIKFARLVRVRRVGVAISL